MAYSAKPSQLPLWGTATGSTIVGALTATSALYQGPVTSGGVSYGRIRYQLNAANLASVTPGHYFNVSGFSNALNNGSGLVVYAVNDADNWIEVLSTDRLDNGADQSGAAGSATVTDNNSKLTEPSDSKKAFGFRSPEKPGDGVWNWILNRIYLWCKYLDDVAPAGYLLGEKLTAGTGISIVDNGDNTKLISSTVTESPAITTGTITQASHGFAAKDVIRHNGTSWIKAQGNSRAGCTDVWVVTTATTNTFTAVKSGRVTVASHGLTPGTTYYLSADTAGLLTSTQPVGNTTRALGYFLAVVHVESSSILHILGAAGPTFNPVYAEYVASGQVNGTIAFTVDMSNIGYSCRYEINGNGDGTTGTKSIGITIGSPYGNGEYNLTRNTWTGAAMTQTEDGAANSLQILYNNGSNTSAAYAAQGHFSRSIYGSNSYAWGTNGQFWMYDSTGVQMGQIGTIAMDSGGGVSNITALSFVLTNVDLEAGNFVRLLIDRMPTA